MFKNPDVALARVEETMPNIFRRIWRENEPSEFCLYWNRPVVFFEDHEKVEDVAPAVAELLPLLESNRDRVVLRDPITNTYFEYYYGDDNAEPIANSYQQFLSWLFVDLGFAGLTDLVGSVSNEFAYEFLDRYEEYMSVDDEETAEESRKRFVSTIET